MPQQDTHISSNTMPNTLDGWMHGTATIHIIDDPIEGSNCCKLENGIGGGWAIMCAYSLNLFHYVLPKDHPPTS